MKIIFFGSGSLSASTLEYVLSSITAIQVVAVVTKPEPIRRHRSQSNPIIKVAQAHRIPVLQPANLKIATNELRQLNATAGLLFAYGKILPPELIDIFPTGILNIHPSILPKHRGPAPIEATILAGDAEAGVSLMLINQSMDAGPVIAQSAFKISPEITKEDLTEHLLSVAKQVLAKYLVDYLEAKQPTPQAQDDSAASYCTLIKKTDGNLLLDQESDLSFTRKVRAYQGWPGVRLAIQYNGQLTELSVRAAHISPKATDQLSSPEKTVLSFKTKSGTVIFDQVQLPGKKPISGRDLINGGNIKLMARPSENIL